MKMLKYLRNFRHGVSSEGKSDFLRGLFLHFSQRIVRKLADCLEFCEWTRWITTSSEGPGQEGRLKSCGRSRVSHNRDMRRRGFYINQSRHSIDYHSPKQVNRVQFTIVLIKSKQIDNGPPEDRCKWIN